MTLLQFIAIIPLSTSGVILNFTIDHRSFLVTTHQPYSDTICTIYNLHDNLTCTLIMDHTQQKVIAPTPQGGVAVANSIPRVIGHTENGYAFVFENTIIEKR